MLTRLLILADAGRYSDNFESLEQFAPTPWEEFWFWLKAGPLWLCYLGLLVWMLLYCVKNDPSRWFWVWIMLIVQPVGAIAYFLVRYLPSADFGDWGLLKRWKKMQTISQLEGAATQIGNAYQYVQLADMLQDLKRNDRAGVAYARALEKEPENLAALWGAGKVDFVQKNFAGAKVRLASVLEKDFTYKFGDASLLYGKTLIELKESLAAREHLEKHVKKWRQPGALYLLAKLCADQGEPNQARTHLQEMIVDINSSPRAIARKFLFWKSRARRLLRHLPK